MGVKTRFAPSPTGSLHIGGARTALFNWLFARGGGGSFVLRIEDTDAERSTGQSLEEIIESLRWLGIDWDGEPLRQSERLNIYAGYTKQLLSSGAAFKCYMTPEDLEAERKAAESAGGHFRYKREWAERGKKDGAPFAVRFAVPQDTGEIVVSDLIRGETAFQTAEMEDFVILRTDGMPTYNLASAVDDAEQGITHVIRGDEHLINAPRQMLVLRALGLPVPAFVHLPVILAPDGSKLSKRHGAVSVADFRARGFLPCALANYLARLGWSCGDEEVFTTEELLGKFSLGGLGTSPSNFDEKKMLWLNGVHIREAKTDITEPVREAFAGLGIDVSPQRAEEAVALLRERAETVVEFAEKGAFLFKDKVKFDTEAKAKFINPDTAPALRAVLEALSENGVRFDGDGIKAVFAAVTDETGLKMKQVAQPVRVALTGKTESPGIFDVIVALGAEKTVARLSDAVKAAESGG